ncbi:hypothetical protein [Campylobacter ureolyticus]|uniref:NADH dehydrogenase n=1 Tax=Campylobacter ureolyticus TaxID=827 RepID=A0A6N2SHJ8_9BACT|nr:hypothetical protein [Campylobacter ureolyticus]MCZ6106095.1 hypothetical protein [Campylobacter ureolyticus]MCZ6133717.1 hypothetical protein [Campylobacter ureolyticus]MCZ6158700.1 hypothetical protein [Campylobacter ureolyticus]GKH61456.1 hypothetical protein CE91St25_17920 [Campylobacter ureolyticus]
MKIFNITPNLSFQNPDLAAKFHNASFLTLSPMEDEKLQNNIFVKCEISSEAYVLMMIASEICKDLENEDIGFLSGESSVGEEEIEEIIEFLKDADLIIADENMLNFHKDKDNIKALLNLIASNFNLKVIDSYENKLDLKSANLGELKELDSFDGAVVYKHTKDDEFKGGSYFKIVSKVKDGELVTIKSKNLNITKTFKFDKNLKGTIAFLGVKNLDNYAFEVVKTHKA